MNGQMDRQTERQKALQTEGGKTVRQTEKDGQRQQERQTDIKTMSQTGKDSWTDRQVARQIIVMKVQTIIRKSPCIINSIREVAQTDGM